MHICCLGVHATRTINHTVHSTLSPSQKIFLGYLLFTTTVQQYTDVTTTEQTPLSLQYQLQSHPPRQTNISDISDVPADKDGALSETAARATMFARVASLMNGRSGVRKEVIVLLCDMLNKGVVPLLARGESGGKGDGPALAKALLGAGLCLFQGEVRCRDGDSGGSCSMNLFGFALKSLDVGQVALLMPA